MKAVFTIITIVLGLLSSILIQAEDNNRNSGGKTEDIYLAGFNFVTGTALLNPQKVPMPNKSQQFSDSNFNTLIVRITDKTDGYQGPGIQNEYAKSDAENTDGTLIILRSNSGEYYLYDRSSYKLIKQLIFSTCGQEPEPRWDKFNPKMFYFVCNSRLMSYFTDNDSIQIVHDFSVDFPNASIVRTKVEGDASLDRRYWCLSVEDSVFNFISLIVWDNFNKRIIGRKSSGFPDYMNWVGMSMSGKYCIVGYEGVNVNYTEIFTNDLTNSVKLPDGSATHGDAALDKNGRDVYVYQNARTDFITVADMETGTETSLVPIPFNINPDIGLHFSGNSGNTPGWVLVSTYGSENPPMGSNHSWMDCQLFMVELKSSPLIWRIAHTQSYTSKDFEAEKNYFAECFASINTLGNRIYFGSNWRNYTQYYSETYIALLPDNWQSLIYSSVEDRDKTGDELNSQFEIAPNPACDFIELILPKNKTADEITKNQILVYSSEGFLLEDLKITESDCAYYKMNQFNITYRIDISVLNPGIYLVKSGNRTGKFVKI